MELVWYFWFKWFALINKWPSRVVWIQDPEGLCADNERWQDVNVVSSLLKLYFRKLPDSLITAGLSFLYVVLFLTYMFEIFLITIVRFKCAHLRKLIM